LIIYVWIVENKAKFLLRVRMISRSVSRAAAATLPNCFPRTQPCPGFPKPGCRDVAIPPAAAQALSMPVAQDPVVVAGINYDIVSIDGVVKSQKTRHCEQSEAPPWRGNSL